MNDFVQPVGIRDWFTSIPASDKSRNRRRTQTILIL